MSAPSAIPESRYPAQATLHAEPAGNPEFQRQIGQISRQSSVYFAGTIFTAAAGYVFKVYLARVLGAEALGLYALGMTVSGFFGIFNALGLPQSAVRFVAKYSATERWRDLGSFILRSTVIMFWLNVGLAILMIGTGSRIATHFYHSPQLIGYLPLFALIMLLGALTFFLGQVLTGYKDVTRRTIITSFVANPLSMMFAVLMITLGAGLWGYIFAQVLSGVIVLGLLIGMVWKMTPAPARVSLGNTVRLEPEVISFSIAAFGVGFLEFLMGQADKVLIGFFLDARALGVYAVAMAIVAFIPVLLQSVNQIFSPVISDLHTRGQYELLGQMFQTLTKWILAFTIPLAVVVMIEARPMMGIFGQEFEKGWPILVIGTLGQLVNCGVGSVGYMLLMSGNQHRLIKVQAAGGLFMVAANLLLIPRFGIVGAALAAAVTVGFSNVWYLREVRRALGFSPYNLSYVRLLLPVVATVATAFWLRSAMAAVRPAWILLIVSCVAVYVVFTAITLLIGLEEQDRQLARAVWARIGGKFGGNGARPVPLVRYESRLVTESEKKVASDSPIFIVGPSRSGTTLLARMLDSHSSLAIFPETWCYVVLDRLGCFDYFRDHWQYILFLNQVWETLRQYDDPAAQVLAEAGLKRPTYAGPVRPILESIGEAYAVSRGALRWGEKTPGHVLWLPQIRNLFPQAKILICIRDPLDVILSYDERWGGGRADTAYLMRASAQVRHYLHHLVNEPAKDEHTLTVRYEALTAQPQDVLQAICRFLEVEFEPGMLEFYRSRAHVERNTSEGQHHRLLDRPATTERVGRFRTAFSPSQIALIERYLGDEMQQLGYAMRSSGTEQFNAAESAAFAAGEKLYDEMHSGAIRSRSRRRGKLKLDVYRLFGNSLGVVPGRRMAVSSKDWEERLREPQKN